MFEALIACLPDLEKEASGEQIIDRVNDGTPEHPKHFPFVDYSSTAMKVENEIYNIVNNYPELGLTSYEDILKKHGIDWEKESMKNADVSKLDAQAVMMALLVGAVRADRFCEGTYKDFIDNGCIRKWIERLKEIVEEQPEIIAVEKELMKKRFAV